MSLCWQVANTLSWIGLLIHHEIGYDMEQWIHTSFFTNKIWNDKIRLYIKDENGKRVQKIDTQDKPHISDGNVVSWIVCLLEAIPHELASNTCSDIEAAHLTRSDSVYSSCMVHLTVFNVCHHLTRHVLQ